MTHYFYRRIPFGDVNFNLETVPGSSLKFTRTARARFLAQMVGHRTQGSAVNTCSFQNGGRFVFRSKLKWLRKNEEFARYCCRSVLAFGRSQSFGGCR